MAQQIRELCCTNMVSFVQIPRNHVESLAWCAYNPCTVVGIESITMTY